MFLLGSLYLLCNQAMREGEGCDCSSATGRTPTFQKGVICRFLQGCRMMQINILSMICGAEDKHFQSVILAV